MSSGSALVLVVEDEALLARNLNTYLTRRGFEVVTADSVEKGLAHYDKTQPDAVLLDYNLPDGTGLEMIRRIRSTDRMTKLIMMTAHGSIEVAVNAMKEGADDYISKPVVLEEVAMLIDRLLGQARMEGSLNYFRTREQNRSGIDRILGSSPAIETLKARMRLIIEAEARLGAQKAAPPVLIMGDTGTGKELIARALHYDGFRSAAPFIEVNCGALPENLIESELFGHERGAFTGATSRKVGLFQSADGGTLFLDEIGEAPPLVQVKLLKVLEESVVRPVGSVRDRRIDVRIVAATNVSLQEKVDAGAFRSDLFYRLNTLVLDVPPLRDRSGDIVVLAEAFLDEFRSRYGRTGQRLSAEARDELLAHCWPGNVRELRNVIEQACMLSPGRVIDVPDLNLRQVTSPGPRAEEDSTLNSVERNLITGALKRNGGNVTLAARALGISRDTLRYRMDKHGIRRTGGEP